MNCFRRFKLQPTANALELASLSPSFCCREFHGHKAVVNAIEGAFRSSATMTCPPETSTTLHPVGRPLSRPPSRTNGRSRGDASEGNGNLFGLTRPSSKGRARTEASSSDDGNDSCSDNSEGGATLQRRRSSRSLSSRENTPSPPRAFSDTAVSCMRRSSSSSLFLDPMRNLPRTNATFSLVQRSGAPMIREIVASMDRKTEAASRHEAQRSEGGGGSGSASSSSDISNSGGDGAPAPPRAELTAFANCPRDAYYRVIAAASGGIPSVVRAMRAFRDDEETQASGCAALASICVKNASNQSAAGRDGALGAVLAAMARFPGSVAVQGAGCDALDALTSMTPRNVELLLRDGEWNFEAIVEGALGRFLPPSCREGAKAVLRRAAAVVR
uniref:Uncharacterized protein n=1 Tax=Odontella aurita TaxID=265563 RepID=A0A7S4JZH7_9STRA|mmetsp:Transcript_57681/g.172103  ORF Transcript_57681/g.172103 Transcript_57681/m.172103 type:complete len:387 (+) Transcript_57681:308-1468(+)